MTASVRSAAPGRPPPRIHDPELWRPAASPSCAGATGSTSRSGGLRSSLPDYVRFVVGRQAQVRMVPSRSLAALYHGRGRKLAC